MTAKLKTVEFKKVEVETDINLPVYFCIQKDAGETVYEKVTEDYKISIYRNVFGTTIEKTKNFRPIETLDLHFLCEEEEFEEILNFALDNLR